MRCLVLGSLAVLLVACRDRPVPVHVVLRDSGHVFHVQVEVPASAHTRVERTGTIVIEYDAETFVWLSELPSPSDPYHTCIELGIRCDWLEWSLRTQFDSVIYCLGDWAICHTMLVERVEHVVARPVHPTLPVPSESPTDDGRE